MKIQQELLCGLQILYSGIFQVYSYYTIKSRTPQSHKHVLIHLLAILKEIQHYHGLQNHSLQFLIEVKRITIQVALVLSKIICSLFHQVSLNFMGFFLRSFSCQVPSGAVPSTFYSSHTPGHVVWFLTLAHFPHYSFG